MRNFYMKYCGILTLIICCMTFSFNLNSQCITTSNGASVMIHLGPGECEADTNRVLAALGADLLCDFNFDNKGPFPINATPYAISIDWDDGMSSGTNNHTITVVEHPNQTNVLACNNIVQISLDDVCEIPVHADLVLEGNNYGCYEDFEIKLKHIEGDSSVLDMIIRGPGTYAVTVTNDNPSKNNCWGTIIAEDKQPPVIWCTEQVIPCVNSIFPGDPIYQRYKSEYLDLMETSTDMGDHHELVFDIDFELPDVSVDAEIYKVELFMYVESPDISGLDANLWSPEYMNPEYPWYGPELLQGHADLFYRPMRDLYKDEHCTKEDIMANFFDDAPNKYKEFENGKLCRLLAAPSVFAEIKPKDIFEHAFKGHRAYGDWTLTIRDWNDNPIVLKRVILRVTVKEGYVHFPVHFPVPEHPSDVTIDDFVWDPVNKRFVIQNESLSICDAKYATFKDVIVEDCDEVDEESEFDGVRYYKYIERTWKVFDAAGNYSTCVDTLYLESGDLGDEETDHIECPPNFDDLEMPSFRCPDEYEGWALPNGAPAPHVTGYPFDYRTPDHTLCPNIQVTFDDLLIHICPNSFKVVRNWTILDWCTGEVRTDCNQVIKVVDNLEPWVEPKEKKMIAYMDDYPYQCGADFKVPPPIVKMECGNVTWKVAYKHHYGYYDEEYDYEYYYYNDHKIEGDYIVLDEIADLYESITIPDLPHGFTWIKYIVEDECENVNYGRGKFLLKVKDNVPPVPVCDKSTTVAVSVDGHAVMHAESLDDGSWDNCGIWYFQIAKMTDKCHDPKDPKYQAGIFQDKVYFCCEEIGDTLMVALRVWDHYGNYNDCMVEVWVQDKIPPFLKCPPDVTLECQVNYLDLEITGYPEYLDNCQVNEPLFYDYNHLDQCGTGYVERDWWVSDVFGFTVHCYQHIFLLDFDKFEMEDRDFPPDSDLIECGSNTHPSITGEPCLWDDDKCSLVAATYKDLEFVFVDGACKKVIREWTVIDWCQYQQEDDCIHDWKIDKFFRCPDEYDPVCGCDGVTYKNACAAEKFGGVSDYIKGPCNKECKSPLNLTEIYYLWGHLTYDSEMREVQWEGKFYYILFDSLNCKDLLDPWTIYSDTIVYDCHGNFICKYGKDKFGKPLEKDCPWFGYPLPEGKTVWDCYEVPRVTHKYKVENGLWEYTQIIKLNNLEPPQFNIDCDDVTICSYGPGCGGEIHLWGSAADDCTPADDLNWHWKIYEFGEGFPNYPSSTGHSIDASGYYPDGRHRIVWSVEDQCGNVSVCDYYFTVVDCKEPVPYCISSVTTVVMPSNGQVQVWAVDFDFGSEDNCTPKHKLKFSFSEDTSDKYRLFDCDDIPNGKRETITLNMWVTDEEGNQDYCQVWLDLQDNVGNFCEDTEVGTSAISGRILTESKKEVLNVEVMVNSTLSEFPKTTLSDQNGMYSFSNLTYGYRYDLSSSKSGSIVNGVSTLDLVLIQKHILGLEHLDSPYKMIAADADNNNKISAADLIQLRKLILGVADDLPNGQESWRFVDASNGFSNPDFPFPFKEVITINKLDKNVSGMDFMAVKIGDVNGNAKVNQYDDVEVRSGESLEFVMEWDAERNAGTQMIIPVKANNFVDIVGFQYSLKFDEGAVSFTGYHSGSLLVEDGNFGLNRLDEGLITMSWNDVSAHSVSDDDILFSLEFEVKSPVDFSEIFTMNSELTSAEAYSSDYEELRAELKFRNVQTGEESDDFELFQNTPNPFSDFTVIGFKMPVGGKAQLNVYDVTGKVIYHIEGTYSKGYNEITLKKSELATAGVLYYTLQSDGYSATRKMIAIE